jgi:cytochrome c oxidase assembly factor CtaG
MSTGHPSVLITLVLLGVALVYLRGWIPLRRTIPNPIPKWRFVAFCGGLALVWIALASPCADLDDELLLAHMVQHLLLMTLAAPLVLLGAPALVLRNGLPRHWRPASLSSSRGSTLPHPTLCWLAGTGVVIAWHIPALFELGMRSEFWREVERASFLAAGLLFWWPIIPWQGAARWPQWLPPLYLFLATLPCDALSAFLTFCDRVVYPSYQSAHRMFGLSALQDQQWAGTLMWVWVTFAYLVPAVFLTMELLAPPKASMAASSSRERALTR